MNTKEITEEQRFDRLIKHLEELERQTGRRLRKTPRFTHAHCPIGNFAPGRDKSNYILESWGVLIFYFNKQGTYSNAYDIYTAEDSDWWKKLPYSQNIAYTNKIIKWLKERK